MEKASKYVQKAYSRGFFHLYGSNLLLMASGFGLQLFVAHLLPADTLGDLKVMQSYFAIVYSVCGLGLNLAILKLASENLSEPELNGLMKHSLLWASVASAAGISLVVLLNFWLGLSPSPAINDWVILFVWSIPLIVYGELAMSFLQARKRFRDIAGVSATSKVIAVILGCLFTWVFGAWGVVSALILGHALTVLLYLRQLGLGWWDGRLSDPTRLRLKGLVGFSLLANLIGPLNNQLDLLMLDRLIPDRDAIGTYSLAIIFFTALMQLFNTLQMMMIPSLSEISEHKDAFRKALSRYGALSFIASTALGIVAAGLVPLCVNVVFGEKFEGFSLIFGVLILRFILNTPWSMARVSLIALGRMDDIVLATALTLPVTFLLTLYLVDSWGLVGAAWAQVVGTCLLGLLSLSFVRRRLNDD